MNPNHYLAVAIRYLLTHRPRWPRHAAVGKTLVSSSMIDRVVEQPGPHGCARCRSASSGSCPGCSTARAASAARRAPGRASCAATARVWTTDKDGPILGLLAAEITARTGKDPGEHYRELTAQFGTPYYTRIDAPATPEQKAQLCEAVARGGHRHATLAGEPITAKLTQRPGQRRADRRPEGRDRRAAGSRPGRRAPRTSTRSTPRAFRSEAHLTGHRERSPGRS